MKFYTYFMMTLAVMFSFLSTYTGYDLFDYGKLDDYVKTTYQSIPSPSSPTELISFALTLLYNYLVIQLTFLTFQFGIVGAPVVLNIFIKTLLMVFGIATWVDLANAVASKIKFTL